MTRQLTIPRGQQQDLLLLNPEPTDLRIIQEEGSLLRLHILNLNDADADSHIVVEQNGTACTTLLYGLAILQGTQQVSNHTHIRHAVGGGSSSQLFKYILDDRSRGFFRGELVIAEDAQKTEARQTNRNLLLSQSATMRTMPQLEIYADDVKASHGATTGQLDESALFYMQQRGLSPQSARLLLIQAFISDVLDSVADPAQRERITQLALNRLQRR